MLKVSDIHKSYKGFGKSLEVLRGVSLEAQEKDIVCIIGPSGAGKSTLLHIVGGLDEPSSGYIELEGRRLNALSQEELASLRNKKIGFVFQFYHLLNEFNVLENVMLPALIGSGGNGLSRVSIRKRAEALLGMVGLGQRKYYLPKQLSGGEMQRVAIVRAIINNPALLLCDEPTGNLDSDNGKKIRVILKDLNVSNKTTIIIVTHDESISDMADKIIHLRDGLIVN